MTPRGSRRSLGESIECNQRVAQVPLVPSTREDNRTNSGSLNSASISGFPVVHIATAGEGLIDFLLIFTWPVSGD